VPTANDFDAAADDLSSAAARGMCLLDPTFAWLAALPVRGGVLGADLDAFAAMLRRTLAVVVDDLRAGAQLATDRAEQCRALERRHLAHADALAEHRRTVALAASASPGEPPVVLPPPPPAPPDPPAWAVLRLR
jgi:hypothetical protein